MNDRAADGAAELVLAQGALRLIFGVEKVARIEDVIALEAINRAVNLVGARLQAEIDDSAGLPAILCRRMLRRVELLNRVNRQNGAGRPLHTFGIEDDKVVISVLVRLIEFLRRRDNVDRIGPAETLRNCGTKLSCASPRE